MNGSVITPMNWLMALNVVCCEPVAVSPETCVRPAGVSAPNTIGMPPVRVEEVDQRVGDGLLVDVKAATEVGPAARAAARSPASD